MNNETLLKELKEITRNLVIEFLSSNLDIDKKLEVLEKVKEIFDCFKLEVDFEVKVQKSAECKSNGARIIFYQSFFSLNYLEQLEIFVHEYAHAISSIIGGDFKYNILEEGMADIFAELVIDYALKKDFLNEKAKKGLNPKQPYYLTPSFRSYGTCREFVKALLAMLSLNDDRHKGLFSYLCISKGSFNNYYNKKTNLKIEDFFLYFEYHLACECSEQPQEYTEELSHFFIKNCASFLDRIDGIYLIEKCTQVSNDASFSYFYHNRFLEHYLIRRYINKYMPSREEVTINNFLKFASVCQKILRQDIHSNELDNILSVLYEKEPTRFKKILPFIKRLPAEIGIKLLSDNLKNSKNPFKTITRFLKKVNFDLEDSSRYLVYYDATYNKKDSFTFLSHLLVNKTDSCYYYFELMNSLNLNDISKNNNILILKCLFSFLQNNSNLTNDYFCLKTFQIIEIYLDKMEPIFGNDILYEIVSCLYKTIKKRYLKEIRILLEYGLVITDIEDLELTNCELNDLARIIEIVNDSRIKYYHFYFINILIEIMNLMSKEEQEFILNKLKENVKEEMIKENLIKTKIIC